MQARGENMKAYPIGSGGIARWFRTSVAAVLGKGKKDRGTEEGMRGGKSRLTLSVQAQISGQPGSTSTYIGVRDPGAAAQSNIECGFECGNAKGLTFKYSGAAGLGMGISGSAQFNVEPQGIGTSATGGVASENIQGFAPPSPGVGWTF